MAEENINIKMSADVGSALKGIQQVNSAISKLVANTKALSTQLVTPFRAMGQEMKRMAPPDMTKAFTISDAVSDSLTRAGRGLKDWTWGTDAANAASNKLAEGGLRAIPTSMTEALNKSLEARNGFKSYNDSIQAVGRQSFKTISAQESMKGAMDGANASAQRQVNFQKQQVKTQQIIEKQLLENSKAIAKSSSQLKQHGKVIDETKREFAGWAMSLMFAGMAMKKMFDDIWKSSTKVFQDISHSVEGTSTSFDVLEGSMKFMWFIVGQALEPVAAAMIPIIDKIAEIIEQHPKLVSGFIVTVGVIGTMLMYLGMGKLAWDGLVVASLKFKGVIKALSFSKLGGASRMLTVMKAEAIATGAALKAMSLTSLLGLAGIIAGIVLLITWWVKLKEAMGGWGEFFKSVLRSLGRILITLADWIVMGLVTPLQFIIGLVGKAMRFLGQSEPGWMRDFVNWKPEWAEGFAKYEQDSWMAPEKGYGEFGGLTPEYDQQGQGQIVNYGTINVEGQSVADIISEIDRAGGSM